MPGLHDAALLCQYLYNQSNLPANWTQVGQQSGNPNLFKDGEAGYLGQAFLNTQTNEVVVVHRGTKFYPRHQKLEANPILHEPNKVITSGNLYNDSVLADQRVPPECRPALQLAFKIRDQYPKHKITQIGHSLGGFHANIVGYFCQQQVIAFDPPGSKQQIEEITNYVVDNKQFKQHYNLLAQKDLVNAANTQVGNVFFRTPINDDWRPLDDQTETEQVKTTLKNHGIATFIACIPADAPDPSQGVPAIFVTPEYYREQGQKQLADGTQTKSSQCQLV